MSGVKVINLSFSYDKQAALERVSFEVNSSEVLTILGPNGSGKTTLLRCLNKLLKPKGSVLIDSVDISQVNEKELAKLIGYVPQTHFPAFPYKVVDVVVSGKIAHLGFSMPTEEDYDAAYEALGQLGLRHLADRPYTQISGGELRLVLLARALFQQPKVLLVDEPASHLDLRNKALIVEVLRGIADQGIIVITSEHDPSLASVLSDKVLLIESGKVMSYGKARDVLTEDNLFRLYGIGVEIFERNGARYMFPIITGRRPEDREIRKAAGEYRLVLGAQD